MLYGQKNLRKNLYKFTKLLRDNKGLNPGLLNCKMDKRKVFSLYGIVVTKRDGKSHVVGVGVD